MERLVYCPVCPNAVEKARENGVSAEQVQAHVEAAVQAGKLTVGEAVDGIRQVNAIDCDGRDGMCRRLSDLMARFAAHEISWFGPVQEQRTG